MRGGTTREERTRVREEVEYKVKERMGDRAVDLFSVNGRRAVASAPSPRQPMPAAVT